VICEFEKRRALKTGKVAVYTGAAAQKRLVGAKPDRAAGGRAAVKALEPGIGRTGGMAVE